MLLQRQQNSFLTGLFPRCHVNDVPIALGQDCKAETVEGLGTHSDVLMIFRIRSPNIVFSVLFPL